MTADEREFTMSTPIRLTPAETRRKTAAGEALLVCAYADEEKFIQNRLEGAISFNEFVARVRSLPRTQEILFYCA